MRAAITILALLTLTSCQAMRGGGEVSVENEAVVVQRDVRAMQDALFRGDSEGLVQRLYPGTIQKLGGPERTNAIFKNLAAAQVKTGVGLDSVAFPAPPEFIDGKDGRRFAVIPLQITISRGSAGAASTGFYIAVKEAGADRWTYIPGPFVNAKTLPALLPDFPAQHPLPKHTLEKLPPK